MESTHDLSPMRADSSCGDIALPFPEMLDDLLIEWARYGAAAAHSRRTIQARAGTIRLLARDGLDPLNLTGEGLVDWFGELRARDGHELARSSRATYRSHVRAWCQWLLRTGRAQVDPSSHVPSMRVPRPIPRPLTAQQVAATLDACAHPSAARTRAYVLLGAYAGLRTFEIAKVRGEDFGTVLHVVGKGDVSSTVPISPVVARLADQMPPTGYWFPSTSAAGHVHRSTVSAAIKRAFGRAGIAGATPHSLRHFYCTEILRATGDLRTTQRAARHASPATTAIYTLVADSTLSRAVSAIPGAA